MICQFQTDSLLQTTVNPEWDFSDVFLTKKVLEQQVNLKPNLGLTDILIITYNLQS